MTATANDPVRVIGAILSDPRYPGSVRIMAGGRLLLTVPRSTVEAERLAEGVALTPERFSRLCGAADEEAAFRTAVRKLQARPFAVADLTRRLILKGHPPGAAAAAVERARLAGLVDDDRFARNYIDTRSARGRGPARLRRDLSALGVDRGLIDRALADCGPEGGAEAAQVERLVETRAGQLRGLPAPVIRRRLLAFLARRGFGGRIAREAVGRVAGQGGS